jgi:hypothetical protein
MRKLLARSRQHRNVEVFVNFDPAAPYDRGRSTLLIGGTHGDERATVAILENFISGHLETGLIREPVAVIPLLNPDGHARNSRHNGLDVDLNRNFPFNWRRDSEEPPGEAPLSEPEARALHAYILAHKPAKIVSLHWALAEIDADGRQSEALGRCLWEALGPIGRIPYRLRVGGEPSEDSCPGSLGQWCGFSADFTGVDRPAMVTLELPYHPFPQPRPDPLPEDHLEFVRFLWDSRPEQYLAGVQGPVHSALAAACRMEQTGAG